MSMENAKQFLQKANDDANLKAKLEGHEENGAEAVKLGAEAGFSFTAEEYTAAYDEMYGELSDEELEDAAGGLGGKNDKIRFD